MICVRMCEDKESKVKTNVKNSVRVLMTILLMMAGTGAAMAYNYAGTTVDKATRISRLDTLSAQSGSNYIRIEPEHLPATIIYTSSTAFGPIPMALVMSDTIEAERFFTNCQMGWKWVLEDAETVQNMEIKAHEDALLIIDPFVCQPTASDTTAEVCGSIEWRGRLFEESGNYHDTLVNAMGCDSVRTLHLTVYNPEDTEESAEAWDSIRLYDVTYTASGDYELTRQDAHECEFTHTLHLTIHTTYRDTAKAEGCQTATYKGVEYIQSGVIVLDTTVYEDGNRTIHVLKVTLDVCPHDTTLYFCAGQNTEHTEYTLEGNVIRYVQYMYESPAEWDYLNGVIKTQDDVNRRTLVDLPRAEQNLRAYYVGELTGVKSIKWSFRGKNETAYHVIQAGTEPQWMEEGVIAVSVRFVCGQMFYDDISMIYPDSEDIDLVDAESGGQKMLIDGQIVIIRNGVRYNLLGGRL